MCKRGLMQGVIQHRLLGHSFLGHTLLACSCLLPLVLLADDGLQERASEVKRDVAQVAPKFRTELIRGRVLWLADALKSEFAISSVPEARESALAILTKEGTLVPIVENLRGRAFRKDIRLRDTELELSVRSYEKQPYVQIVAIYEVAGEQRYEIDYWCDVCAIVMYETGPCACCQDDNRLRKRLVKNGQTVDETAK